MSEKLLNISLGLLIGCCLFTSCDSLEEDNALAPNSGANFDLVDEYFAAPQDAIVINLGESLTQEVTQFDIVKSTQSGELTYMGEGFVRYETYPDLNRLEDSFEYEICLKDGNCLSGQTTIIIVNQVADYPCIQGAHNDWEVMDAADSTMEVSVLSNDRFCDDNNGRISLELALPPHNGSASIVNGQIRYRPLPLFGGVDGMVYAIRNLNNNTRSYALLEVDVKQQCGLTDFAPVADQYTFQPSYLSRTVYELDLLANDNRCGYASIEVEEAPRHGRLEVWGSKVTYEPDDGYYGKDQFVYRLCPSADRPSGYCPWAMVKLEMKGTCTTTVDAVNDQVTYTYQQEGGFQFIGIDLLGNDEVCTGDADDYQVEILEKPTGGSLIQYTKGYVLYKPQNIPESQEKRFSYVYYHPSGAPADTAEVIIHFKPFAGSGCTIEAFDDTSTLDVNNIRGNSFRVDILSNDQLCESQQAMGDLQVVRYPENTTHNAATVLEEGGILFEVPEETTAGPLYYVYKVCDSSGQCDEALLTLEVD